MMNVQDFDSLSFNPIRNDVRQSRQYQLSGSFLAARPPALGISLQRADGFVKLMESRLGKLGMMLREVILDVLEVVRSGRSPADVHLGLQHALNALIHLFFFDEFAAIGLLDAFTDACSKQPIVFDET
jgi:hypothetical protein